MSKAEGADAAVSPDDAEFEPGYKAPEKKALTEILEADKEDPSLQEYKRKLLGEAAASGDSGSVIVFPDDPRQVIVTKLSLVVDGREDKELDLTGNLEEIKKTTFTLKEGVKYKIKIQFYVQKEIVTGLKYVQKTSRMGIHVDKMTQMVGSYAPKETPHEYVTPWEDAPSGMAGRGKYHVYSLFTDDDKDEHLKWEWKIEVGKDWGDA